MSNEDQEVKDANKPTSKDYYLPNFLDDTISIKSQNETAEFDIEGLSLNESKGTIGGQGNFGSGSYSGNEYQRPVEGYNIRSKPFKPNNYMGFEPKDSFIKSKLSHDQPQPEFKDNLNKNDLSSQGSKPMSNQDLPNPMYKPYNVVNSTQNPNTPNTPNAPYYYGYNQYPNQNPNPKMMPPSNQPYYNQGNYMNNPQNLNVLSNNPNNPSNFSFGNYTNLNPSTTNVGNLGTVPPNNPNPSNMGSKPTNLNNPTSTSYNIDHKGLHYANQITNINKNYNRFPSAINYNNQSSLELSSNYPSSGQNMLGNPMIMKNKSSIEDFSIPDFGIFNEVKRVSYSDQIGQYQPLQPPKKSNSKTFYDNEKTIDEIEEYQDIEQLVENLNCSLTDFIKSQKGSR